MKICHPWSLFVVFGLWALGGGGATRTNAATANPFDGYSSYTQSYTLPYANNPGFGAANPVDPTIHLVIDGTSLNVPLDTGSRALYVSANELSPNISLNGPAGYVYLNSSARIFQGTWTTQTVTFPNAVGAGGATGPATATIPILVVQALTASATPQPGSLTPGTTFGTIPSSGQVNLVGGGTLPFSNHTLALQPGQVVTYADNPGILSTTMNFGVGFDRSGFGTYPINDSYNQQYNAFLNLAQMQAGTMVAGYVLTQTGVQLGLTGNTTGFAYTDLVPTGNAQVPGSPPDWQAPLGTVTYNGTTYDTGQLVVDIGIPHGILTLPGQPTTGTEVTLPMTVNLINSGGAVSYVINNDASNILNPSDIAWFPTLAGNYSENQPPLSEQFFNTGRNVLNAFDFLYDGAHGYVGLAPNGVSVPGADLAFTPGYYPATIPEPAAVWLPIVTVLALGVLRWRGKLDFVSRP